MMSDLGNGLSDKDLTSIDLDVLIGIGELDNMVSLEESQHAAHLLPNGKLKMVAGFKHPIEKVDMTELASVILGFMKKK